MLKKLVLFDDDLLAGSTIVEKVIGENISVEAVKKILKIAKTARKKLQRVNVTVSLKGIEVSDTQGNELFKISIYRISNCSTDASHRQVNNLLPAPIKSLNHFFQVFSFISTDEHETMECHAFLCPKRKMAETVTLACAHAFSTAYQAWRILPEAKQFEKNVAVANENMKNALKQTEQKQETREHNSMEEKLIDFEDDDDVFFGRVESAPIVGEREKNVNINNQWVSIGVLERERLF